MAVKIVHLFDTQVEVRAIHRNQCVGTTMPWSMTMTKTIEPNVWETQKPSINHWKQWAGGWKTLMIQNHQKQLKQFDKCITIPSFPKMTIAHLNTSPSEPASAPTFLKSKITTLPTSLDLHWTPPPNDSINGEFLGYVLTYQVLRHCNDQRRNSTTQYSFLMFLFDLIKNSNLNPHLPAGEQRSRWKAGIRGKQFA